MITDSKYKDEIHRIGSETNKMKKGQIVLLTLPTLDGYPIESATLEIARKWGIGDKERRDGILILYVKDTDSIRIETAVGMEHRIPDIRCVELIDMFRRDTDKGRGLYGLYQVINSDARLTNP